MKNTQIALFGSLALAFAVAHGAEQAHWGYEGSEGPEHWGELDPAYALCAKGKNQSPINLTDFIEADLPPVRIDYLNPRPKEILNNGHTIQANFPGGNTLDVGGRVFELKHVHFHAPSENQLDGESFPLGGHFVHADADGNLAVVAVMYQEGPASIPISRLWEHMPENAGDTTPLEADVNSLNLLPEARDYYRFNGSLTTPPCTEGVWWLVMKQPVSVSGEQVEQFKKVVPHPNNRPVQPVNARPVLQ